jgi:hypothetical protein
VKKVKQWINHHISVRPYYIDISLGVNVVYSPYKPRRVTIYITLFKCVITICLGKDKFVGISPGNTK